MWFCCSTCSSLHISSFLRSGAAAAPGAHEPSDRVKKLAEEIPQLNLIEVNDLLKLLQVRSSTQHVQQSELWSVILRRASPRHIHVCVAVGGRRLMVCDYGLCV
jgi:hypothetical protein